MDHNTLEIINKFYYYYQIKSDTPKRFKFTLKNNKDFNYKIITNVIYLNSRPVFYVVNASIFFQAGRFLASLSVKET